MVNRAASATSAGTGPVATGRARVSLDVLAGSAIVLVAGIVMAIRYAWVTDDAYISFRYADNLIRGLGLVYNAGERVEGYSNFLWTLLMALGSSLRVPLETWSMAWGIVFHASTLLLLLGFTWRRCGSTGLPFVPAAALVAAVHRDWAVFATSGLETSLFTLLAVVGYLALIDPAGGVRRRAVAGAALALAALTRPDGAAFTGLGALFALFTCRRRWREPLAFVIAAGLLLVPYAWFKLAFYGDLLPNTYYAKSAYLAWYEQGLVYVGLYFRTYPLLLLGLPLALWGARRGRANDAPHAGDRSWRDAALLAATFAVAYTWLVARVGGDFMFARLLIPATPFYAILLELGLERLPWRARWPRYAAAGVIVASISLAPRPFPGFDGPRGIADEWVFYHARDRAQARRLGERLGQYFEGLPVRIGFVGGQAIVAYYSRAPVAIETATGLTDSLIAHQRLERRGRIGHEKTTPIPYVVDRRRLNFWLFTTAAMWDTLSAYVPAVPVTFDSLTCMVLTWDPDVMRELRRRGAQGPDFETILDEYLRRLPEATDEEVRTVYEKSRRFYFAGVSDARREQQFLARLRQARSGPAP